MNNRKIVEYTCVQVNCNAIHKFKEVINGYIDRGWQPFGTLCVENSDRGVGLLTQALVKYEETELLTKELNDVKK